MVRNEAGQGSDLGEHAHLVHLLHRRIQHLALERSKHDRLVLDRIHHESLSGLNRARADIVDRCDGYHESVLSRAGALDLGVQLLFDRFNKLRAEVTRMQQNFVLERYLRKSATLALRANPPMGH